MLEFLHESSASLCSNQIHIFMRIEKALGLVHNLPEMMPRTSRFKMQVYSTENLFLLPA